MELGLTTAFMVGLLGSVHCIGMCGGIVGVMGAGSGSSRAGRMMNLLAYNTGRIASYGVAGLVAGLAGSHAFDLFPFERVAEVGLLVSGSFMILLGLYLADWWRGLARLESIGGRLWTKVQPLTRRFIPVRSVFQAFPLGLLWGWLPCGLVYATLVWALFTADPLYSMLIMVFFGLGTLPMLLSMGGLADRLSDARKHPSVRRFAGVVVIVFGALTFLGVVHPIHPTAHPVGLMCTPGSGLE